MSGPDPTVEAGAHALGESDSFGCGCCSSGGEDRHDDGTTCHHEYRKDCPDGAQLWTRAEVCAADVLAAARPLIEAEVREGVARELDDRERRWRTRLDATEDLGRGAYYSGLALAYCDAARIARGGYEGTGSDA